MLLSVGSAGHVRGGDRLRGCRARARTISPPSRR
jgi:hypothetical protein